MIRLTDEEIQVALEDELDENLFKEKGFATNSKELFIAKAQLKKVVEWGDMPCVEHEHGALQGYYMRRLCKECWQALLEEVK